MHEWQTIIIVAIGWVFGAGLNYGIFKTQIQGLHERLTKLEDEKYLTRTEYEARHNELITMIRHLRNDR